MRVVCNDVVGNPVAVVGGAVCIRQVGGAVARVFFNLVLTVLGDAVLFAWLIGFCTAFVACLIVCTCVKTCPLLSLYLLLISINAVFWLVAIPVLIEWLFSAR